jgi:hypothetical protein
VVGVFLSFLGLPAVHVVVGPLGRGLVELGGGAVGGRRGLDEARDSLLEGVGGELGLDFLIAGEGLPVWDDGVVCETCSDDVSWRLMGKGRVKRWMRAGVGRPERSLRRAFGVMVCGWASWAWVSGALGGGPV